MTIPWNGGLTTEPTPKPLLTAADIAAPTESSLAVAAP
jgi:hypothetical protein